MRVIKRNGDSEDVSFDKVLKRIKVLSHDLSVDVYDIAQKVCARIYDGVKTTELDELAGHICSSMLVDNQDYGVLASRIIVSNHHKNTSPSFSETIITLYNNTPPLVSDELYDMVMKNKEKLNSYINYERDYGFDYFGFKTLEKSYLMKVGPVVVERPQHMFMRVAIGIHGKDLKDALQTYDLMSTKHFVHATPTLFNAGTPRPQCSSCFLIAMKEDSIDGIYDTLKECAMISKYAGGIGLHLSNIRARNSRIRGTNGTSTGIGPMLRVFNNTARYVNQCFTPETLVYSKKGVARMDAIKPGDELVTIDGTFKKVNSVSIKDFDGDLLEVVTEYGMQPVKVTKEHEMYVIRGKSTDIDFGLIHDRLERKEIAPEFVSAGEMTVDDFVGYPIPTDVQDIPEDADFCRFYGVMLAYGHHTREGEYKVGAHLDEMFDFMIKYLTEHKIQHKVIAKTIHSIPFSFEEGDKMVPPRFLNLPKEKSLAFLQGIQGAILPDNILMSVRYIQLRHGILTSGCNKQVSGFFEHNGILWSRISSIKETPFNGQVYDFNMMDNHNYTVANFGLVHNSGRRNGSIAIYLEPWHADVETFLEMKKPQGTEEDRARDLFYALWIPDLFMERVRENKTWSLMCPDQCKGLSDVWGEEFKALYEKYEREGMFMKQVKAQDLWFKILELQIETGVPYLLFKDAANGKSNQQNLGTIKSSNLCSEVVLYSDDKESAVCNLASICLPTYIDIVDGKPTYNFDRLHDVTKVVTKNLNKVIDLNFYPVETTRRSNFKHRPIGIGVQGLADTFIQMKMPFDSSEAAELNCLIFETIYHAAMEQSMLIAKKRHGVITTASTPEEYDLHLNEYEKEVVNTKYPGAYSTFEGSPVSRGIFQFDMWGIQPTPGRYDWDTLKDEIKKYGVRNSVLMSPMPTASTSQIMGFNEAFEPYTSNLYKRKTLAGEFILVNKYLMKDLNALGLWNKDMKNKIIIADGSIQNIPEIPQNIKDLYKIVWEIKQKVLIDMAADRGAYICQSQSMNLFVEEATFQKLSSMHFYTWQKGLKTGIYYLRTRPRASAQKFTIDPSLVKLANLKDVAVKEEEECVMCSA